MTRLEEIEAQHVGFLAGCPSPGQRKDSETICKLISEIRNRDRALEVAKEALRNCIYEHRYFERPRHKDALAEIEKALMEK